MPIFSPLLHALSMSFSMAWEIFWALCLGFAISAIVQAVVGKGEMSRLLPDASLKTLTRATLLGAASSSCSYAAVAIARSMVQKKANFTAAIAFEFASTNLVVELGIILWLLVGWQFALAEYVGGIVMVLLLATLFRIFLPKVLVDEATEQAERNIPGRMEGHAGHDMSISGDQSLLKKIASREGFTAISHFFVMDFLMMWKEIFAGLLMTGALAAWVPHRFWQGFFHAGDQGPLQVLQSALLGPLVAILSFVCSIGNVPLAAVLWNGGISFAGVVSFLFADLLILPILSIYRKYYGWKMTLFLAGSSYVAMVAAGIVVEVLFRILHLIPATRVGKVMEAAISWNYTTFLNLGFAIVAVLLYSRYRKTGGPEMMKMMDGPGECHH